MGVVLGSALDKRTGGTYPNSGSHVELFAIHADSDERDAVDIHPQCDNADVEASIAYSIVEHNRSEGMETDDKTPDTTG